MSSDVPESAEKPAPLKTPAPPVSLLKKIKQPLTTVRRSFLNLSGPARAAVVFFLFLICLVIVVSIAFLSNPENIAWRQVITLNRVLTIIGSVLLLPCLLYQGLRLWMEDDTETFRDLNDAFSSGLHEIEERGMSLTACPLFLVLGSTREDQEAVLMQAAFGSSSIQCMPHGPTPLHWWVQPDGIFLFLTEISRVGMLNEHLDQRSPQLTAGSNPHHDTDRSDQASKTGRAIESELDANAQSLPPSSEKQRQRRRIEAVCSLVRKHSRPGCPCHGILVSIPFSGLSSETYDRAQLESAIRADLVVIQRELQVRCPVMLLVTGLEQDAGFREIILRLGLDEAKRRRFGIDFDVHANATADDLSKTATLVSHEVENCVYELFRQSGALNQPGNKPLFSFLVQFRTAIQTRLAQLLTQGFGFDKTMNSNMEPILFCGCYFAATGPSADQQAFVKGPLDRLVAAHDQVEWIPLRLKQEQRFGRWLILNLVLIAALVVSLLVSMGMHFRGTNRGIKTPSIGWSHAVEIDKVVG